MVTEALGFSWDARAKKKGNQGRAGAGALGCLWFAETERAVFLGPGTTAQWGGVGTYFFPPIHVFLFLFSFAFSLPLFYLLSSLCGMIFSGSLLWKKKPRLVDTNFPCVMISLLSQKEWGGGGRFCTKPRVVIIKPK